MAATMALLTFLFFASLDYVISRRRARRAAPAVAPAIAPKPVPAVDLTAPVEPVWVAGYELPEDRHYHRGHTWVRPVGTHTVAIGIDDFARRLTGTAERLEVPAEGTWLRQGDEGFKVAAGDRVASFVSPVHGKVTKVNPALVKDPSVATKDPYGRGWLCLVDVPSLSVNLRNLFSGRMARRWMEDAREQLELKLMALSGTVLQDGGEPVADFARHLDHDTWQGLVSDFLLTREEA
jgi:glycine cleavage system H protein